MIPITKVFVGSLPPGSKPGELRRLFESYGVVTECDIMNRCGFVHMETQEMAQNAIKALNNTSFKGSLISVEPGRMKDRSAVGIASSRRNESRLGTRGRKVRQDKGSRTNTNSNLTKSYRNQDIIGTRSGVPRRDRGVNEVFVPGFAQKISTNQYERRGTSKTSQSRNFDSGNMDFKSSSQGNLLGSYVNCNDRFNGSIYGLRNQDRRGFTLPERPIFPDDRSNQGGCFISTNSSGNNMGINTEIYDGRQTSGYSDSSSNRLMNGEEIDPVRRYNRNTTSFSLLPSGGIRNGRPHCRMLISNRRY